MGILEYILIFIVIMIWSSNRWILLYRFIRKKKKKKKLTKKEIKFNKIYRKIINKYK